MAIFELDSIVPATPGDVLKTLIPGFSFEQPVLTAFPDDLKLKRTEIIPKVLQVLGIQINLRPQAPVSDSHSMGADILAVAYQEAASDVLKQVRDETTILDVFFRAQQQNPFSYQQMLSMAHDEKPILSSQFDDPKSFCFIAKKMAEEPLSSDFSGKLEL